MSEVPLYPAERRVHLNPSLSLSGPCSHEVRASGGARTDRRTPVWGLGLSVQDFYFSIFLFLLFIFCFFG